MRRKYLGLAIAAITAFGPASAFGGDREIAQEIMTRLKSTRDAGALKDFTLDMKVDQGVVLFRGSVSESSQKDLVLAAAKGIDGITKVVDEVSVQQAAAEETADVATPTLAKSRESLRKMLTAGLETSPSDVKTAAKPSLEIAPGEIQTTAAVELATPAANDQEVVASVVKALSNAQQNGHLRGFGVDVQCNNGVVTINGRAATPAARDQIVQIAQATPGVQSIDQQITVLNSQPTPAIAPARATGVPAQLASNRMAPAHMNQVPTMAAPQQMGHPMSTASAPMMGTPVSGQPVPMNYGAAGAPRYDAPNLPNYAWPGYAAYPNYAALTYPQQYSPSAWPYIGPFYPYPQVPLGWRKVSLEWDDGWWFLDFTDR
ncbi:BON domain-containing protein [Roseiconus lacunae]|uniref:BON domain-containing protein n=1 Tax=Roseiconus lacunae TaxID=2605694 RepID=A0ABT7PMH6_9BACT|nr:BON domain-containing protein [Roseiconus lacunae]MDM4017680.1 BON domain-containing protein [Roseiconus lacunae]WRQ51059.1 BON domain-containing protein [Stieleria sp. HD01]